MTRAIIVTTPIERLPVCSALEPRCYIPELTIENLLSLTEVLYEGSLNVLSQNNSFEAMRRIESVQLAWQMIGFIGLDRYL